MFDRRETRTITQQVVRQERVEVPVADPLLMDGDPLKFDHLSANGVLTIEAVNRGGNTPVVIPLTMHQDHLLEVLKQTPKENQQWFAQELLRNLGSLPIAANSTKLTLSSPQVAAIESRKKAKEAEEAESSVVDVSVVDEGVTRGSFYTIQKLPRQEPRKGETWAAVESTRSKRGPSKRGQIHTCFNLVLGFNPKTNGRFDSYIVAAGKSQGQNERSMERMLTGDIYPDIYLQYAVRLEALCREIQGHGSAKCRGIPQYLRDKFLKK